MLLPATPLPRRGPPPSPVSTFFPRRSAAERSSRRRGRATRRRLCSPVPSSAGRRRWRACPVARVQCRCTGSVPIAISPPLPTATGPVACMTGSKANSAVRSSRLASARSKRGATRSPSPSRRSATRRCFWARSCISTASPEPRFDTRCSMAELMVGGSTMRVSVRWYRAPPLRCTA